jgi:hypothetical protein
MKFCIWSFVLLLLAVNLVAMLVYFAPDESLKPEAQALLQPNPAVALEKNGAVYLAGITAEQNPFESGRAYVAAVLTVAQEREAKKNVQSKYPSISDWLGAKPLDTDALGKHCKPIEAPCLREYQNQAESLNGLLAQHATLLARYDALKRYPRFQNPMPSEPDAPAPPYKHAITLANIELIRVALALMSNSTQTDAINRLTADSRYWRSLLANQDDLIGKMVATAAVTRQIAFASEIIAHYPELSRQHAAELASVVMPLSAAEHSLRKPLAREFRMVCDLVQRMPHFARTEDESMKDLMVRKTVKPNATINLYYSNFEPTLRLENAPASSALAEREKPSPAHATTFEKTDIFKSTNPVGIILASLGGDHVEYVIRLHDLDALARMGEVQRQIAVNKVPTLQVQAFIATLPSQLNDPYTGQPIAWDAATKQLSIQLQGKNAEKRKLVTVQL